MFDAIAEACGQASLPILERSRLESSRAGDYSRMRQTVRLWRLRGSKFK